MNHFYAFLLGMWEFRRSYTTHVSGYYVETYDQGRDFAHMVTLRHYET